MSKDNARRMVTLQASGGVFAEAWKGNTIRLSDQIAARPGDMIVLAEWLPIDMGILEGFPNPPATLRGQRSCPAPHAEQARASGREVQGRCAAGSESGRPVRYFAPVLRWDLVSVLKNTT
jgi:hypothetical protein